MLDRLERLAVRLQRRAVPTHWSFVFGVISMACLAVLVVTGVFLTFHYDPSSRIVEYHGTYRLLRGVEMSKALDSTLHISFEVRGGLLMRQAHHWAALMLPASIILQMLSLFFTGTFRRPRQWTWVLLFLVFVLVLVDGWSGYALPDDMLSGTGLRIVDGILVGLPVIGTRLSRLVFGGEFPGEIVPHLYVIHVYVVPPVLAAVIAVRQRLTYVRGPAQPAGPGRTEQNVAGLRLLPTAAARAAGLFVITIGVLVLMAGILTISPVWLYGPSSPSSASAGSQPDWYTGFLDGALRLVPTGWEFVWLDQTWTLAILVPLAVVTIFFLLVATIPFIEARVTRDSAEHHVLDRPRNAPTRTGLGVAGIVFFGTLWAAGSIDIIATQLQLSIQGVVALLQAVVIIGPAVAFAVTRQLCLGLQGKDRDLAEHGLETGQIVREPGGGYAELERPLEETERWRLDASRPYHRQQAVTPKGHGELPAKKSRPPNR